MCTPVVPCAGFMSCTYFSNASWFTRPHIRIGARGGESGARVSDRNNLSRNSLFWPRYLPLLHGGGQVMRNKAPQPPHCFNPRTGKRRTTITTSSFRVFVGFGPCGPPATSWVPTTMRTLHKPKCRTHSLRRVACPLNRKKGGSDTTLLWRHRD